MEPEKKKIKIIQTYADDVTSAIESGGEGLVKKIIHEQEEQEEEKKRLSPESEKNRIFMFVGLALILLALAVVAFLVIKGRTTETVDVERQFVPLIFTDRTEFIEIDLLDKNKIAESFRAKVSVSEVEKGSVEGVYLSENKKVIGLARFLELTESNFPDYDKNFISDNFFIGILGKMDDEVGVMGGDLFFLWKVRSFSDIFPLMKSWETKMLSDLYGFFGIEINSDTGYLLTKNFEDGVMGNKNARILYDNFGNIVLMYVFADETSVVITDSSAAVREAISRLSGGEIRK